MAKLDIKRKMCVRKHGREDCDRNGNVIVRKIVNAPVKNTNRTKKKKVVVMRFFFFFSYKCKKKKQSVG